MTTIIAPESVAPASKEPLEHQAQLLFKEALERQRRRRRKMMAAFVAVIVVAGIIFGASYAALASSTSRPAARVPAVATATSPKMIACNGATVVRPTTFVITCADDNSQLTKTRWTTWTAQSATGVTTFALNLCKPYCAASKMSYFPNSSVRMSSPVATKHGRLFSVLVVRYRIKGHAATLRFSWRNDPSF
jgi:hypothetical protein